VETTATISIRCEFSDSQYCQFVFPRKQPKIVSQGIKKMKLIRRRAALTWVLCASLIAVAPAKLYAHAVLVESNPKAGSTVKGPGLTVWLRFNVRVDGSRSRCTLSLPNGTTKSLPLDKQSKPDILTGKATGLSPGKYQLQWQVLAADGHISRGELTFNLE